MFRKTLLVSLLALNLLASCEPISLTATPAPPAEPTLTPTLPAPTQSSAPFVLRVWVTPRFDPAASPEFQARLEAFATNNARLTIEVRVKDEADLLEALRLTAYAAPAASPDLVLLARADLETAAAQGLVQPLQASLLDESDWHPLARSLGQVGDALYAIPCALDTLALGSSLPQPLAGWQEMPEGATLAFNVNDATFPLALYLSAGGELADAEGNPALDEARLVRVLSMFAGENLSPRESQAELVSALGEQGAIAVGWASSFLGGGQAEVQLDALPGLEENSSASLVTAWGWSVASVDAERQRVALELLYWLTEAEFLNGWTASLGYLPPRAQARWKPLLDLARPVPPAMSMESVLPILSDALRAVLDGAAPEAAARAAVEKMKPTR